MNTVFEVIVAGESEPNARGVAADVFCEIDRLERMLSRFDSSSDVGQLNLLNPGSSVHVSREVYECLLLAAWAYAETDGAFDVTIGPVMDVVRGASVRAGKPGREDIESAVSLVGMNNLLLSAADCSVSLREGHRVGIDLGAIGKGHALDKAAEILERWEIKNYLLSAGTSTVLAAGNGDESGGWYVGIGGEWGKAAGIEGVRLHDEALSGSGTEEQGEHIRDPRTGLPAKAHLAAWARCPSAACSDALSTAFMVMSTEKVREFCARHEGVGAVFVEEDGAVKTIDVTVCRA
ncbi:MAG: FAD:protein FMN transferase [bacterium]